MKYQSVMTVIVLLLLAFHSEVHAGRLSEAKCVALKERQKTLIKQGVKKRMAKGPKWAKANLKPEQLNVIRDYITVSEQIKFRCSGKAEPKPKVNLTQVPKVDPTKKLAEEAAKNEEAKKKDANIEVKSPKLTSSIPLPVRKPIQDIISNQIKKSIPATEQVDNKEKSNIVKPQGLYNPTDSNISNTTSSQSELRLQVNEAVKQPASQEKVENVEDILDAD